MKKVIVGDVHLNPHGAYSRPEVVESEDGSFMGTNYYLMYRDMFRWLASEYPPSEWGFIFLGDVSHTRGYLDSLTIRLMAECYSEVTKSRSYGDVEIVLGNHDMQDDSGFIHNLHMLNVVVHSQPHLSGDEIAYLPYHSSVKDIENFTSKSKIAFGHFPVKGAQMGVTLDEYGVDPSIVKCKAILGHYHDRHTIRKHIEVLGSSFARSYSEVGPRYIGEYLGGDSITYKKVEFGPEYVTVRVNSRDELSEKLSNIREFTCVRLYVDYPVLGNDELDYIKSMLRDRFFASDYYLTSKASIDVSRSSITDDVSEREAIEQYVESVNTDLDKDQLRKVGISVLDKVMED